MSRPLTLVVVVFFLIASCIIMSFPVKAVSKTIIVPDDYQTLSSAIGNATAGDIIFVKKGTYEEKTVEINAVLNDLSNSSA